ncbi:aminotransferase class I/II-fold pyridoxal phosphate-dependent enzyme [Desulfovibrio sp. OttesenSCG-928-A18]|nr:aminotransferase class I/II-fold pyridoxal phosphate-dependent enzyme [Desulfovibrio sp. OttesenSCG-928-A18]
MATEKDSMFGLDPTEQKRLFEQLQPAQRKRSQTQTRQRRDLAPVPERFGRINELPEYKQLLVHQVIAEKMDILNPFFTCHDGRAAGRTQISGEEFLNFATYDYLGLNGHPEVNAAAAAAMEAHGTSAGASRLVAGERPPHIRLEKLLAETFSVDAALSFVSGHATNVSTLATLLGPRDAVYHDALAHNSIITGAILSGAKRYSYPHNDCEALDRLLGQTRSEHERVVIASEGLFSMDGSVLKLPELLEIKKKYTCFLMVDEAHSLGVLGATGRGCAEHFGVDHREVDIWMGTLSKTLCGCGGFIAGSAELIQLLKFRAPGFVYSVGMPPPIAAASAKAIEIMLREPERTAKIREKSAFFLKEAKNRGLNTGYAEGYAIIPIIVGNSLVAGILAAAMFRRKINVLPIIYPAVEEGMARLRFFLSAVHDEQDCLSALDALVEELPKALKKVG